MEPTTAGIDRPTLVARHFTTAGVDPFDEVGWEIRDAWPNVPKYHNPGIETPDFWSQTALDITSKLYLAKSDYTENSIKQLISRIVNKITVEACKEGYFTDVEWIDGAGPQADRNGYASDQADIFADELKYILLHQRAAFNSPVWFNVGRADRPQQVSACQPYHAMVSTPDGLVPIGELVEQNQVDREVYDSNGLTRILATKENGTKRVFRIRLRNGQFVEATADHIVSASPTWHSGQRWVTVDQVRSGMFMELHAHRARARSSERVLVGAGGLEECPDDDPLMISEAALAGWLQADGFVGQYQGTNSSLTMEFQVTPEERPWIEGHLEVVFPDVHRKVRDADTQNQTIQRIRLYGEVLRDFIDRWGLLARRHEMRVPEILWTAHEDVIHAYLKSVFQADGYCANTDSGSHICVAVISERWTEELQLLLSSLGIYSKRRRKKERRENRSDLFEIDIAWSSERARFAESIGFVTADKQARVQLGMESFSPGRECKDVKQEEVVGVEDLGLMPVYDIQTESGEYLTNNIKVHNCFILGVDDSSASIMETSRREAFIFKGGSGSGFNVSALRGSMEPLSTGGIASGPVSFMRMWDAGAGTFKSGGTTRRAAKLVRMDADHPDILDFIESKVREEDRMEILIKAGINLSMDEEGERNVAECTSFQNANISVGVTDDFMRWAGDLSAPPGWPLIARKTGEVVKQLHAAEILDKIAQAAWRCADPGMQFDSIINSWHTTPAQGPIRSSNPCFPGETLVDTSEGRIRIDELANMYASGLPLPYAFGWDREGELPAMKRIRQAVMTKMVTELVEVTTDKGVVFRCTPDHKILTRVHGRGPSGDYVAADDLVPGQRLRKIGRTVNQQRGGRHYINHRTTDEVPNGTVWQSRFMWEEAYGPVPEGMEVHHLNEDPTDDRLSNFELVDEGAHQVFHSSGERNGRYMQVPDETLVEIFEALEDGGQPTPSRWNGYIDRHELGGVIPRAASPTIGGRIRGMSWDDFVLHMEGLRSLTNDSVQSVRRFKLDKPIPVYDISVEDTHNFAVATEGVDHTIVVSNCGEYLSNDDTSCNLASINVLKFLDEDGSFDVAGYQHTVDVMATAMDICVSFADFPDEKIADRTRKMRQLGLGYSNMGAAIMAQGMAYDSEEARDFAAAVTAMSTGRTYRQSALLASRLEPFYHYEENSESMLAVIRRHIENLSPPASEHRSVTARIWEQADEAWHDAFDIGRDVGFRNAQASVLAPAGTTSYLLDCDTTGVEPAFTLVSHKELAGGGSMVLVNQSVDRALHALGYDEAIIIAAESALADPDGGVEAMLRLVDPEHHAVFHGANEISAEGHIRMLAAVQPFVSGGISKTINMPEETTWEEIREAYVLAWKLGCKSLALYRNNSKVRQVLSHTAKPAMIVEVNNPDGRVDAEAMAQRLSIQQIPVAATPHAEDQYEGPVGPERKRMPRDRTAHIHKFNVGGHEGYLICGEYEDGKLGEVFLEDIGKEGSHVRGMANAWAIAVSIGIQHGVPLETLVRKYTNMDFEPNGPTENALIPHARSIVDYVSRFIVARYLPDLCDEMGIMTDEVKRARILTMDAASALQQATTLVDGEPVIDMDKLRNSLNGHLGEVVSAPAPIPVRRTSEEFGPPCGECGGIMRRAGSCYTCPRCGNNTGCG